MALLHRKKVLAAKIEAAPGTAVALAAADGAFNVEDVQIDPNIDMTERPAQNSLSQLAAVPGARAGKLSFALPIIGGATAPAWATTFLPACGFKATGNVYALTSLTTDYKTLTMGLYLDGVFHSLAGAMGTVNFEGQVGKPIMARFEFSGVWQPVSDVANLAPTFPTVVPPRFAGATLTLGTYSPKISKLNLNLSAAVTLLEDATAASGYAYGIITGRKVSGTMDAEAVKIATQDVWGQWLSGAEAALTITLGTTGNQVSIAAPKTQYRGIKIGNRGDVATNDLDFQCNRSAANDDELTITFA